ncbi:ABC transporter substrate-binding protein [Pelagibacterium montanilacus]|uniref:ABC transporter substrate-binding protein n=1 Tax=Pelagibacterium montanilacus TaxID=2185280 RepID=UPI000F8F35DE|nr:extracellular solute-binding protein [Pelagibacterium montanilacus]
MKVNLNRRTLLRGAGATGLAALAAPAIIRPAFAQAGELNVWSYSGFITDDFRQRFEEETGIRLNIRMVTDQGEQFNLMAAEEGNYSADIVCCAGHRFYQFVDAGFLEPVDMDKMTAWDRIEPEYAEANWVSRNGERWGVPLVVVSTGLLYDSQKFDKPTSWDVMFDPANAGQTTYQIQDFFQIAMNYLGYDGSAASYMDAPEQAQEAVNATRDFLIEHKDKVRRYYDAATEIQQMFVNGDVSLAQAGSGPSAQLIIDGFPAGYTIPEEGGLAYAYGFNITRNATNMDNAYTFLNALLSSPENGAEIVRSTGYASVISGTGELLTPEERAVLALGAEERARLSWVDVETAPFIFDLIDTAAEEIRAA